MNEWLILLLAVLGFAVSVLAFTTYKYRQLDKMSLDEINETWPRDDADSHAEDLNAAYVLGVQHGRLLERGEGL